MPIGASSTDLSANRCSGVWEPAGTVELVVASFPEMRWHRATTWVLFSAVLMACGSGRASLRPGAAQRQDRPTTSITTPAGLSLTFTLPSTTVMTGSSVTATITVENTTGRAVTVVGCLSLFAVAIRSEAIPQAPASAACRQDFTIVAGTSTYTAEAAATYLACSQAAPQGPLYPSCVGGDRLPNLPPGKYEAALYAPFEVEDGMSVRTTTPPPIPVTVTARS